MYFDNVVMVTCVSTAGHGSCGRPVKTGMFDLRPRVRRRRRDRGQVVLPKIHLRQKNVEIVL